MSTEPMNWDDATCLLLQLAPLYTPQQAMLWMLGEHPQLDGRRPVNCELGEVVAVVERLKGDVEL